MPNIFLDSHPHRLYEIKANKKKLGWKVLQKNLPPQFFLFTYKTAENFVAIFLANIFEKKTLVFI